MCPIGYEMQPDFIKEKIVFLSGESLFILHFEK